MATTGYSPQEAAAVSRVPLSVIQKAITARKIPARTIGPTKRRVLDKMALLAFALADALPKELHLSPDAAYLLLQSRKKRGGALAVGAFVTIDTDKALAEARRRLALYERAPKTRRSRP